MAFLPLLVFEAALFADAGSLKEARRPIVALSLPGVAISLLATAGVATFSLGLPFSAALLLGALLAIAVELKIEEGAWVCGRSVSDIAADAEFPPSCVIAGMALGGKVQAPRGATVIQAGVQLLVVSARSDLARSIAFFRRRAGARPAVE